MCLGQVSRTTAASDLFFLVSLEIGEIFCTQVRLVHLNANEFWAPTILDTARIRRCDRSMIPSICNFKWTDRVDSNSLLERLMIPSELSVLSQRRLRWDVMWKGKIDQSNRPKTKVMICASDSNPLTDSGKYLCAVCRNGV